jgi:protein SCO1/2
MTRSQRLLIVFSLIAAAVLGAWWAARFLAPPKPPVNLTHGTLLVPARAIGMLDLVDQNGKSFTQARLEGRWSVVYFGFTSCPMICPTTMAMLRNLAQRLEPLAPEARPQVILITVDPQTDTPAVMGRYVAGFNPAFLGLTGTQTALDAVAKRFSVAYGHSASGTIDHSSTIYVVDPEGALAAVFTPPQTEATIADDYRRLVGVPAGT